MTSTWEPQPRPDWVERLNQIGRNLGSPSAVVALDEASLLQAATEATGLEGFGPDEWREGFRLLLADLEESAELTLVGRMLARADIVRSLIARLRMAQAEHDRPEILEEVVEAPIIITGMGRTGTSILQEVLAQDPALRTAAGWEQRYPATPAAPSPDASADIDFWVDVVPEFLAMHESTSDGPDEDSVGQMIEFTSPVWTAVHRAPTYDAWAHGAAPQMYRFQRRLMQHLQHQQPGRWLTKAPHYLSTLPALFAEFPDARIVHTHRDPLKVLASTADMMATLRWQRSDRVDHEEFAQGLGFGYPFLLDMVLDQRTSGAVPDDRFVDVRYADLIADQLGTIEGIYERLGMELTGAVADRMRAYLAARPKGRHGGRTYRFSDLGLDEAEVRGRVARYMDHFGIPEEEL